MCARVGAVPRTSAHRPRGDQHLTAVSSRGDAGGPVHVDARRSCPPRAAARRCECPSGRAHRLLPATMRRERSLRGRRRAERRRLHRRTRRRSYRPAYRPLAAALRERRAEKPAMIRQNVGVTVAELLKQRVDPSMSVKRKVTVPAGRSVIGRSISIGRRTALVHAPGAQPTRSMRSASTAGAEGRSLVAGPVSMQVPGSGERKGARRGAVAPTVGPARLHGGRCAGAREASGCTKAGCRHRRPTPAAAGTTRRQRSRPWRLESARPTWPPLRGSCACVRRSELAPVS